MLHSKERIFFFMYCIFVSIFLISIITCYNLGISYAQQWEACSCEYTVIDMLSEMFFSEHESKHNIGSDLDTVIDNNLPSVDSSSFVEQNQNIQIIPEKNLAE